MLTTNKSSHDSYSGHIKPTTLLNDMFNTNYSGGNHTVKCIFHGDNNPSLSVNYDNGKFECKSCGKRGTDVTDIYMQFHEIIFTDARHELIQLNIILAPRKNDQPNLLIRNLLNNTLPPNITLEQLASNVKPPPIEQLAGNRTTKKQLHGKKNNKQQPLRVDPSHGLIREKFHTQIQAGYQIETIHTYRERDGSIIYWRIRFKHADGSKKIMPLSYEDGDWKIKDPSFEGLKPLYNLHLLEKHLSKWVYFPEGEKCTDDIVSKGRTGMTSGGATSVKRADFSLLQGKQVALIADNNKTGLKFVKEAAKAMRPYVSGLCILDISKLGLAENQDISDWFAMSDDNTMEKLDSMIEMKPVVNPDSQESIDDNEKLESDKINHLFEQFYCFNETIYVKDKLDSKNKFTKVCKYVEITAFTRCSESTDYGAIATFYGKSKTPLTLEFDFKNIHVGTELIERFSDAGLYINPTKSAAFKQYIAAACERQTKCLRRSLSIGWFGEGQSNFVLPDKVIGPADDIIFQPKEPSPLSEIIKSSGSLKGWKGNIGSKLKGNHYLAGLAGLSLSSLLLKSAKIENRGFNLSGGSGSGLNPTKVPDVPQDN